MKKINTLFLLFIFPSLLLAQVNQFIHVDQFGYFHEAEKVAVLSNPQEGFNAFENYSPPDELEIRRSSDDAIMFLGNISSFNAGSTDAASGDQGWWFDFSDLTEEGEYYVYDPLNNEKSADFIIAENPYLNTMKVAGRMFFYNRCNFPKETPYAGENWTDGQNFMNPGQDNNARYIYEPNNSALEKDLSGGWFDAGDYNKYVTFTEGALNDLLWAVEENENAFSDNWNIPESGNTFPDIIDEIKWELDWLLKMTNDDGSVHIKLGSQNYSENISSPPSANTDGRYYGPTCTSASAAAANIFSHAAIVLKNYEGLEGYAATLAGNAFNVFQYTLPFFENNQLEEDCDDGSIVAGDADRDSEAQKESMIAAAVYLFELTGDETYHDFFKAYYAETATMISGFWGADAVLIQDALIRYAVSDYGELEIQNEIKLSAEQEVNNNWNGFFGWLENDLYRSFMPDWSYFWGSNRPKAGYGNLNFTMAEYELGDNPESLRRKATEHLHYFHGVNPLGMVMLSNMYEYGAEKSANEIYHTWFYDGTEFDHAIDSPKGPAPGFLTGGPNPNFSFTQLSPPANQPILKSYLDFNTGFPESSWEISEPAIYYQAAYIRLLANFVNEEEILSAIEERKHATPEVETKPNPASSYILPQVEEGKYFVQIINAKGQVLKSFEWIEGQRIQIENLPSGLYYIKLKSRVTGKYHHGRWIK